ncbi:MAG TPA: LppX_LprAFG lipoprotein [Ktedonobacteraceae bacterium]
MSHTYKKPLFFAGMITLLLLLAACSVPGTAASPGQTLLSSASAMGKLSSVHFDLQTVTTVQSNSSTNGLTYPVTGQGDATSPDKVSIQLSSNGPLLGLISSGQNIYVQSKGGPWYSVDKSNVKDAEQSFFSQSLATRLGQIMSALQNAQLTDHGQETVNGESLDHLTVTIDQQTLKSISSELNGLAPADSQSGLNQIKKATLDLWIDTSTSYVHLVKVDIVTQVDATALEHFTGQSIGATGALPIEMKAQVTFSKFNQPVNIQPPTSATPLAQ